MRLQAKTALVTGGAHRVGRAITLELAAAGANVVINHRSSSDAAEETAAECERLGVSALVLRGDVGDRRDVEDMVRVAETRFGHIDVLVNSASPFLSAPFPTADLSVWDECIATMVHGPFLCANAVAPGMLAAGEGAIVNISDLSSREAWPQRTAHAIGKSSMVALARQLAIELAPTVRVNAVVSGPVLQVEDASRESTERSAAATLLGRWGRPEDISATVRFLVESDFITGESVTVDGGQRYGHRQQR